MTALRSLLSALRSITCGLMVAGTALAQSSRATHPHVADLPPGPLPGTLWAAGPFLNVPDGAFNNGEEPRPAAGYQDHGGYLDLGDFTPVLDTHVHRFVPAPGPNPEGWTFPSVTIPGVGTHHVPRLHGYLRGQPVTPGQPIDDAAFELLATPWRERAPVLLVVSSPPTSEFIPGLGTGDDRGLFAYPGHGQVRGLPVGPSGTDYQANVAFAVYVQQTGLPTAFNVLAGRALQRCLGRNLPLQMQRNLQLVRAMQAILQGPDASWRPPNWPQQASSMPVMADGGSYGGYCAMWAVMLFPNDFHGAFAGGAPTSIRTYVSEQQSWQHLQTLLGLGSDSGRAFAPFDTLHYGRLLWQYQQAMLATPNPPPEWHQFSPFFHTSVTRAWRDGTLKRPVSFVFGDEDQVHTGTVTMPRFHSLRSYQPFGEIAATAQRPYVGWAIADKRCHPGGPHTTAKGTAGADGVLSDMYEFIPEVRQSWQNHPTVTVAPPPPVNETEDPYEHVFRVAPYAPIHPQPTPLWLDESFGADSYPENSPPFVRRPGKAVGNGLWLGGMDSLVVHGDSIFAGSAEGVVTQYRVNTTTREPEPIACSTALGYGASALAVGDVHPNAGVEVVVGVHRGLFVLGTGAASGELEILAQKTDLPWQHTRPHHLKIADIESGGQLEFAFATELGDLVVCGVVGGGIVELWRYPEPGIVDLECLGGYTFALLTSRGHLVKIARNPSDPTKADLLGVSKRLFARPVDLERSGDHLIVLQNNVAPGAGESLRKFRVADLDEVLLTGSMTNVTFADPLPLGNGTALDLEILPGGRYWVVLSRSTLFGLDSSNGSIVFSRNLSSYSTTAWPLDIAAGDVQAVHETSNPWSHDDEVVISTRTGYVTWLPLARLFQDVSPSNSIMSRASGFRGLIAGGCLDLPDNTLRLPGVDNGPPAFSSRTTSGTWAITQTHGANDSLQAIDQAGSRIRIACASGDVTFLHDLRRELRSGSFSTSVPAVGPIRNMAYVGSPASGVIPAPGSIRNWLSTVDYTSGVPGVAATARRLATHPFMPEYGNNTPFPYYGMGRWGNDNTQDVYVYDGYLVFPRCGAATNAFDVSAPAGTQIQAHWWSGSDQTMAWPNLIEGAYFAGSNPVLSWWATSRRLNGTPGTDLPASEIVGNNLRDGFALPLAQADAQSLCVFQDDASGGTRIVVATAGGSAMVLDPMLPDQISPVFSESADFGNGGMALAVVPAVASGGNEDANGFADVYLGVLTYHGAFANHAVPSSTLPADDAVGAVIWLEWTGSSLAQHAIKVLDGSGPDNPKAYGVCGIAVGDAIRDNGKKEMVVTTLDGQLFVFERNAQGHVGALLYRAVLEGSLGPFNSILIADLDPGAPGNEIYVAGSLGLRKLIQL